jgi:hypothetical protein
MRKITLSYLSLLLSMYLIVIGILIAQERAVRATSKAKTAVATPIDNPDCPGACMKHFGYEGISECWCQPYMTLCFTDTCTYNRLCKCIYYQCHGSWPFYTGRQCFCTYSC